MRISTDPALRFPFKWEKAIEAIDFVARLRPNITQYYIGKIIFFADKEHFLDYGRPITGDQFLAMQHGPVPTAIRDLLKLDSGFPDEILDRLSDRISVSQVGNKLHFRSKEADDFKSLSGSDMEYLESATESYAGMSFGQLREISHSDPAYTDAWDRPGNANEMNARFWLEELENPNLAADELHDKLKCAV